MFQFGFLELWVTLIILGTFLRGPNWNFFGPFESWDAHKVRGAQQRRPVAILLGALAGAEPAQGAARARRGWTQFGYILLREVAGHHRGAGCTLSLLPPLMAVTVFRKFFVKMGFIRYMVMANLLLFMMSLPFKMVLRWTVNLKYIVSIPEYFLNF